MLIRAAGLVAGVLLDRALGDPRRWHPVAGFGRVAGLVERRVYSPTVAAGALYTAACAGLPVLTGMALERAVRRHPAARFLSTAALTWVVLGGRSLRREAAAMSESLAAGDLDAARARLPHLAGRDPSTLDSGELSRATIESVAENASDAVVGPLFWGAVAGLPGLAGYRAANTLDAMVGHRSPRYARFGTASARLDDLANLLPARRTALLTAAVAPVVGGRPAAALRTWWRDGDRHPSPNSGQCEAATAGALGVRLGGRNVYAGRVEERPVLGDGKPPAPHDIARSVRLCSAVEIGAVAAAAAALLLRRRR